MRPAASGAMTVRYRKLWTLSAPLLAVLSCCASKASQQIDHDEETPDGLQSFYPGRERYLEVRIPPINKGLGSTPASVNVSFRIDELEKFLGHRLSLSPGLRKEIERDNCRGESDGSHFSLRIATTSTSDPLPIKRSVNNWIATNPDYGMIRTHYGKFIVDRLRQDDGKPSTTSYLLRPNIEAPGLFLTCGHMFSFLEGGCTVYRDLATRINIKYSFCEIMLPYIKELDGIYMLIARAVIIRPKVDNAFPLDW